MINSAAKHQFCGLCLIHIQFPFSCAGLTRGVLKCIWLQVAFKGTAPQLVIRRQLGPDDGRLEVWTKPRRRSDSWWHEAALLYTWTQHITGCFLNISCLLVVFNTRFKGNLTIGLSKVSLD